MNFDMKKIKGQVWFSKVVTVIIMLASLQMGLAFTESQSAIAPEPAPAPASVTITSPASGAIIEGDSVRLGIRLANFSLIHRGGGNAAKPFTPDKLEVIVM